MGGTPLPFKGRQACQPHIQLFFGFAPPSCIHKTKHRKGEKIAFQWPKEGSGILLQALEVPILEVRKVKWKWRSVDFIILCYSVWLGLCQSWRWVTNGGAECSLPFPHPLHGAWLFKYIIYYILDILLFLHPLHGAWLFKYIYILYIRYIIMISHRPTLII